MSEPWQLFFFHARNAVVPSWRDALPQRPLSDQRQSIDQTVQLPQKRKQTACLPPLHAAPACQVLPHSPSISFTSLRLSTLSRPPPLLRPCSAQVHQHSCSGQTLGLTGTANQPHFGCLGSFCIFILLVVVLCFILFKIGWLVLLLGLGRFLKLLLAISPLPPLLAEISVVFKNRHGLPEGPFEGSKTGTLNYT